jgi:hypothetical protein
MLVTSIVAVAPAAGNAASIVNLDFASYSATAVLVRLTVASPVQLYPR